MKRAVLKCYNCVGGQCPCHGHASECPVLQVSLSRSCLDVPCSTGKFEPVMPRSALF